MENIEVILFLLFLTSILSLVSRKLNISYPILLVLAGLVIGFTPSLPDVELSPELVFLVFLPPLLYAASWNTPLNEFKKAIRPISLLAIGLVVFTSSVIALVSSWLIPGFTLAQGFVLGAIVSPPDAVAATSVIKGLGVPKRVVTILEGESLVNDASGLIVYRYAVAAVVTGQFIWWQASLQFLLVALGGVAIGLILGFIVLKLHRAVKNDPLFDTTITLLSPYVAYLIAEKLHCSGVLSVVVAGLFLSWFSSEVFSHQTRMSALSVWATVIFILNGLVFVLIGLQLPSILKGIQQYPFWDIMGYALAICLVTILIRLLWVYPATYLPRIVSARIRKNEPEPNSRNVFVVAWSGMRGVVSLAAALALPVALPNGQPFPGRSLILFFTFCVIFFTLVIQGLSLPFLVKKLGISVPEDDPKEERKARLRMANSAILHLEENYSLDQVHEEVLYHVKGLYEQRIDSINQRIRTRDPSVAGGPLFQDAHKLQRELLTVERRQLIQFKKEDRISDEVIRKLENELDLQEAQLEAVFVTE